MVRSDSLTDLDDAPNGRLPCPDCGSRNTQITKNPSSFNRKNVECRDCNHTWTEYTGPECPTCGTQNTKRVKTGVPPHTSTAIKCFECNHGPGLNR